MGCEFWPGKILARSKVLPLCPFSNSTAQARLVRCVWIASKTQMTRLHRGQELYRRALAIVVAAVALASTSCGSPDAVASNPTPGPVTADSVRMAFSNSTMKNAHFRLHGTFIVKRNYFPLTGDGVLQLAPREAVAMTFRIQTYSTLGVVKFQVVTVGGRAYMRVGSGRWTSKPSTGSMVTMTSYVGEEIMSGIAVWHVRAVSGRDTNDIWIREADAYIVQLVDVSTSGTLTMNFDTYNKSRPIAKP